MKLDKYEMELMENEDLILSQAKPPTQAEREFIELAARNTLNKDKRINIRISSRDLSSLQRKANRYGMPYQTLISSVLHRYVSGDMDPIDSDAGVVNEKPGNRWARDQRIPIDKTL